MTLFGAGALSFCRSFVAIARTLSQTVLADTPAVIRLPAVFPGLHPRRIDQKADPQLDLRRHHRDNTPIQIINHNQSSRPL